MADELDNNLKEPASPSRVDSRIKELSEKVELTAKERDEKNRLYEEQQAKAEALQKERDFFASFSDVVSQNPAAKDHKDEILGKVKQGYTVEDATIAVLAKAGKYQPSEERVSPAGGSASTQIPNNAERPLTQLSREEKRNALLEAEKRGDFALS